jgi:hypothetical protein
MSRLSVVLVACVAVAGAGAGCKKHGGGNGTGGGTGGGGGSGQAEVGPGAVKLIIDGKPAGAIDAAAAARWVPLAQLVPAAARDTARWAALEVHTAGGRATTMPEPASTQPGLIAALFPGKSGIDFGMFTPEALTQHGTPKLVETGVVDVRVTMAAAGATADGSGGSGGGDGEGGGANRDAHRDRPGLDGVKLTIKQAGGDRVVTGDELGKVAKVAPPVGDTETTGWDVASLLHDLDIPLTAKVIVTDKSGASVTMTRAELDPKKSVAFMKLNRSGDLRFRLFQKNKGGGWNIAGELRGVTTIELLAK